MKWVFVMALLIGACGVEQPEIEQTQQAFAYGVGWNRGCYTSSQFWGAEFMIYDDIYYASHDNSRCHAISPGNNGGLQISFDDPTAKWGLGSGKQWNDQMSSFRYKAPPTKSACLILTQDTNWGGWYAMRQVPVNGLVEVPHVGYFWDASLLSILEDYAGCQNYTYTNGIPGFTTPPGW
jgi:hypothetical protein